MLSSLLRTIPRSVDPRLPQKDEGLEAARERLLGFGRGLEVLAPRALRLSIMDFAERLLARYRQQGDKSL